MALFSKFAGDSKTIQKGLREQERIWPPPVSFHARTTKKVKSSDTSDDDDSDTTRSFEILLDLNDQNSDTYKMKMAVFEDGTAEDWVTWRINVDDLFTKVSAENNGQKQNQIYMSLLKGSARDRYLLNYTERNDANLTLAPADRLDIADLLLLVINDTAKKYFSLDCDWHKAYRYQKAYMRKNLFMGDMNPEKFCERLTKINRMLTFFPFTDDDVRESPSPLDDDELCDILDSAKKPEWHLLMMSQGKRPHSFDDFEEAKTYYKQLYNAEQFQKKLQPKHEPKQTNKPGNTKRKRGADKKPPSKNDKPCTHCGGKFHASDACWTLDKNKSKCPKTYGRNDQKQSANVMFSQEQMNTMMNAMWNKKQKAKPSKKRKVRQDSSDSEQDTNFMAKLVGGNDSSNSSVNE